MIRPAPSVADIQFSRVLTRFRAEVWKEGRGAAGALTGQIGLADDRTRAATTASATTLSRLCRFIGRRHAGNDWAAAQAGFGRPLFQIDWLCSAGLDLRSAQSAFIRRGVSTVSTEWKAVAEGTSVILRSRDKNSVAGMRSRRRAGCCNRTISNLAHLRRRRRHRRNEGAIAGRADVHGSCWC